MPTCPSGPPRLRLSSWRTMPSTRTPRTTMSTGTRARGSSPSSVQPGRQVSQGTSLIDSTTNFVGICKVGYIFVACCVPTDLLDMVSSYDGDVSTVISWHVQTLLQIAQFCKPSSLAMALLMLSVCYPAGTSMLIEDVACPVDKLADMTVDLGDMFQRYGYKEASCFGHALEGNLHLVFSQGFRTDEEVQRFGQLMDEMCYLVATKHSGSLKVRPLHRGSILV